MSIENKVPKWRAKASVLLTVVACLMALFHEYTTATLPLSGFMQMAVHLGFAMTIVGLAQIAGGKSDHFTVWDMVGVIIIVFGLVTNLRILATKGFISPKLTANLSTMDTILAVLIIVGILLAVQRAIGTSMSVVAIVFLAYAFVGPYLPGLLKHNGITLNRLLAEMVSAGCTYAFMECSSHAIQQKRIGGLHFAGGIFTNLTRDHLDYHKTFENYRDAKKAFFDGLGRDAFALTNADDRNGMVMVQNTAATVRTYSVRTAADFKGRILEESIEGMLLDLDGREVSVRFVGRFNVQNLLAVYGAAVLLGQEPDEVLRALSALHPVNGRFETIRSPKAIVPLLIMHIRPTRCRTCSRPFVRCCAARDTSSPFAAPAAIVTRASVPLWPARLFGAVTA